MKCSVCKHKGQDCMVCDWCSTQTAKGRRVWKQVWNRYEISRKNWISLAERQGYGCGICRKSFDNEWIKPNIDHDHNLGHVRGLLCDSCNKNLWKEGWAGMKKLYDNANRYHKQAAANPVGLHADFR